MTLGITTDIAIVGAGMAGLMAARALTAAGKSVWLFDKGMSVGGRMATRRVGAGVADHGAQFFTVRTPEFGVHVARWLADGWVFEWSRGWADGSLIVTRDGHARYAARGGMNALTRHLADGLQIVTNAKVTAVYPHLDGWQIASDGRDPVNAAAVLLTPPVPQSLALLDAGGTALDPDDRAALAAIEYEMCLTAVLLLDRPAGIPMPGAIQREGVNIQWIADNRTKGISPDAATLTMQASGTYSRQLWDETDERLMNIFRVDAMPILGGAAIVEMQIKRWRYSRPTVIHPDRALKARNYPPLLFAGDAFGGPRVEGAVMSGLAAAALLLMNP
ncbi:MAG: FAD-dependent oxidoreductase [Chloroflexota bacterium]|nr:FAD-dependent oxidoreductase [Chloroflexota bacterium]